MEVTYQGRQDLSRAPKDVLSYCFHCPSCLKIINVVPVLNVDYEGVSGQLKEWAHAGGPPKSGRFA